MEKDIFKFVDKYAYSMEGMPNDTGVDSIPPDALELIKDRLLELDVFKNVKKMNILKLPAYGVDKVTGDPIDKSSDSYLGQSFDTQHTQTYMLENDGTDHSNMFNETVDLYMINVGRKYTPIRDMKECGVWKSVGYSPDTFRPIGEIRIIWDPSIDQDSSNGGKSVKERILAQVEKVLDGKNINTPYEAHVMLRMSPRSVKATVDESGEGK